VYGNIGDNERRLCNELSECVSDRVKRAASAQAYWTSSPSAATDRQDKRTNRILAKRSLADR
jgi:hypothetical protein